MEDNSATNLIINYLPQSLTDEEFQTIFESIGPVKSSKIIRDKGTGYSYGFGFVDYDNPTDAERAISQLNGYNIQHKHIKVALARPNGENIKGANLYVRNLPLHFRQAELQEQFEPFGNIIQARVLTDKATGKSKGVGFVLYSAKSEADEAILQLNDTMPPGGTQPYAIRYAEDKSKKLRDVQGHPQQHFQQPHNFQGGFYQPIPKVPQSNNFRGGPIRNQGGRYGNRYNPMGNTYGGGNVMGMNQAGGRAAPGNEEGYILFVYNIGYDADEKVLWQLFGPLGTVQKVDVIMDYAKGQCKGYGFVTMPHYDEAQYAIDCMNGAYHNGKQLSVSFKN